MAEPFSSNFEHLQAELAWLDLVLRLGVLRAKSATAGWGGVCITGEAAEQMVGPGDAADGDAAGEAQLAQEIARRREEISGRGAATEDAGVMLRLPRLAEVFSLSPFEIDAVLFCLAPEIDPKYGRLYSFLHDDVTRRLPTVELITSLLCHGIEEKMSARRAFLATTRLFKYSILKWPDAADFAKPLISRSLQLDDGIANYLLGSTGIHPDIAFCSHLFDPERPATAAPTSPLVGALSQYLEARAPQRWIALLHGPDRLAQEEAVRSACGHAELSILRVDLELLNGQDLPVGQAIRLAFREAIVRSAAVYLDGIDCLTEDADKWSVISRSLERTMLEMGWIVFIAGRHPPELPDSLKRQLVFPVEFKEPSFPERKRLWEEAFAENDLGPQDVEISDLAARYRLSRGAIINALHIARNSALLRNDPSGALAAADLQAACRSESNPRLLSFARKIESRYLWDDLVLPQSQKSQLQEVIDYIRHHEEIYTEWGFGSKHSLGKGINILFTGSSGTGKTMAAGVMARQLSVDLYKIDLSTVVSKYIGETEKNLSRVFKEAETSNAILFFDEADALFGKRSEVKDSHDRYANVEVNYLLQKMEEHEGIVILATNLSRNLDEAFLRRFQFSVLFPLPEREERLRIWNHVFPEQAPKGEIDLDFLARNFKITGGNIKNIALGAAFIAKSEDAAISMRHVVLAARREFQKMGKICVKAEFGEYYDLVC